ncbi:MAG: hypothetical protein LIP03_05160 [Bacteroidales bacterium]|nr:hypothetical protein [Bacteroidales bacterium]
MKRLTYLAAAASMLLASCSDEIRTGVANSGQEVQVTFSASLPEQMLSRATNVSDGTTADQLQYTVFKGSDVVTSGSVTSAFPNSSRTQSVSLPLITGETYSIVFWADNASSPYVYNDGVVTIEDYSKVNANDENADAFFGQELDYTVIGAASKTVTLTRPFAQINFGTTKADYEAALKSGLDVSESAVAIKTQTYKTLNLLDGSVDGETDEVVYASHATPTDTDDPFSLTPDTRAALTVEGTDYVYVGYAYVLTQPVDKSENLNEVTLTPAATTESIRTYTNVPVKRNYRTNIIGNLFTSSVDWIVKIDQNYVDDINVEIWDGSIQQPAISGTTVQISNAAELAWLADYVNNATEKVSRAEEIPFDFSGYTVELTDDIYLNDEPWTPIGLNADSSRKFKGTFDGKGYTIHNLYVKQDAAYRAAGLFGALNGTIKDFTIDGAYVNSLSSGSSTDNGIAVVAGSIYTSGTIDNVTVRNAEVYGNRYCGGIVGYAYGNVTNCAVDGITLVCTPDNLTGSYDNGDKVGGLVGYFCDDASRNVVSNCQVSNADVTGYRDLGGLIGCANKATSVTNCTVSDSKITASSTNSYSDHSAGENMGKIIGRPQNGSVPESNVANNVTLGAALEATPDTFGDIMKGLTTDAVITLAPGEYTFSGTTGSKSWDSTFKSWDWTEYATYEGMEVSVYENFYEGQNITLIGSGTDQTVFINSDGFSSRMSAGGIRHQVMVNKANITFKNMLEIVRWYSIIDAKNETHEDCVIWGTAYPRSETVNFNNCKFYTTTQTATIEGTEYSINNNSSSEFNGPILYGMYCRYLNLNDCDFYANQNKAVQIYATARPYVLIDVNATNCTLYGGASKQSNDNRAFFEVHGDCYIHGNMNLDNCSINSADTGNWPGGLVYDGPWDSSDDITFFNLTIDGDPVHSATCNAPVDIVWTGNFQ